MLIGLCDGQIEVRRHTATQRFVAKKFPATEDGAKNCARHITRILRRQPQSLGFSSDIDFPEECGFDENFRLETILMPYLKMVEI